VWKITILRQKNIFFSNHRGARAGCASPPWIRPWILPLFLFKYMYHAREVSGHVFVCRFCLCFCLEFYRSTRVHPRVFVGSCYSIFSFMCMFCRPLFVLLYFFFWELCCLFFYALRILITPLVSSNSSYIGFWNCSDHIVFIIFFFSFYSYFCYSSKWILTVRGKDTNMINIKLVDVQRILVNNNLIILFSLFTW